MFVLNFMRPSLNLARPRARRVGYRDTQVILCVDIFSPFSFSLTLLTSPLPSCLGKCLVGLWGFSPPLIKLIPIELLRCHPCDKGPCFTGVRQARCEAGFDTTRQRRKRGRGERWRVEEDRTEEWQHGNNNQARWCFNWCVFIVL